MAIQKKRGHHFFLLLYCSANIQQRMNDLCSTDSGDLVQIYLSLLQLIDLIPQKMNRSTTENNCRLTQAYRS